MTIRTSDPVNVELPRLLAERERSVRWLARKVDVSQSHLSRIIADSTVVASAALARRIAVALDLDPHYFPESRLDLVVSEVRTNAELRDRLFDELTRDKRHEPTP